MSTHRGRPPSIRERRITGSFEAVPCGCDGLGSIASCGMSSIRSPLGGFAELETESGERLRVETRGALEVISERAGETQRVRLPYPQAGYGGHELLLSASESYLALFLWSGQSEVGYELFAHRPTLAHISSFPYTYGMALGPAFSSDERLFAMAWTTNSGLYIEDEVELSGGLTTKPCTLHWACVRLQPLPAGPPQECHIDVAIPAGFPFETDDRWDAIDLVVTEHEVRLRAEWGTAIRIPLPLPARVVIEGPAPPA